MATIDYFSKRYDFEIEVLVRGIWREHSLVEVDVGVIYPPEDERISHFDKFWDNARITILNIFLIFYSVFFYQRSVPKAAFAGVVGYSISLVASPISAVIIGLILCLLFRLNFLVMFGSFLILRFF